MNGNAAVGLVATVLVALAGVTVTTQGVRRVDTAMLYLKHCASCHGQKGEGTPGVRPLTGDLTHGDTLEEIERVIREGIDETTMKPFRGQLNDAQMKALAQYVSDLSKTR